jgi:hypothetical protein
MALTITLSPETEEKLRKLAAQSGQTSEGFVRQLVEREVLGSNGPPLGEETARPAARTFDEIFAPLRKEVAESGISDDDLDGLLEQARKEVWQERKAGPSNGP